MWTNPEPSEAGPIEARAHELIAPPTTVVEEIRPPQNTGANEFVGPVLVMLLLGLSVWAARQLGWSSWTWVRPRQGRRAVMPGDPLPDVAEAQVQLDLVAASVALATGRPKEAIIRCWLQVQDDVANAGVPVLETETSAEYVQRVISAVSIDPTPIEKLAALYGEARFSKHEMGDERRTQASECLTQVNDALEQEVHR